MKIQINSHDPVHAVIKEFFYDEECDETIKYLGPQLSFPPGRMNRGSKRNDWTMKKFVWYKKEEYDILINNKYYILKRYEKNNLKPK